MYYHVIENAQRNGVQGYRLVKSYRNWKALDKWLRKEGRPLWIVEGRNDWVPVNGQHSQPSLGGYTATYYNTGGYGVATMPVLPFHSRF